MSPRLDDATAETIRRLWDELDWVSPADAEAIAADPTFGPIVKQAHDETPPRKWTCPMCWTSVESVQAPDGWSVLPRPARVVSCPECRQAGHEPLIPDGISPLLPWQRAVALKYATASPEELLRLSVPFGIDHGVSSGAHDPEETDDARR